MQITVDVTEIKPLLVSGGMMGVYLEKGKHHIELFYKLRFMFKGALMTLTGLLIILLIPFAPFCFLQFLYMSAPVLPPLAE
jgi:uncharacterized membrane protein YfhO